MHYFPEEKIFMPGRSTGNPFREKRLLIRNDTQGIKIKYWYVLVCSTEKAYQCSTIILLSNGHFWIIAFGHFYVNLPILVFFLPNSSIRKFLSVLKSLNPPPSPPIKKKKKLALNI